MSKTQVNLQIDGSRARITLSTEGGLNVLSAEVMRSFGAAVAEVRGSSAVRTTTIEAEGKVFAAGADIKAMAGFNPEEAKEYGVLGQGVFNDLEALPSVTVAAINGAAMGGGLEMVLACDFRIAVKHAKLALPEVTLGLIPGWGGVGRLAKLIGPSQAKKLFLSGSPISAEDSLPFGLVDEVVNSLEDLEPRVAAFCKTFDRAGRSAVGLAKRAFRLHDDLSAFVDCFRNTESREGMTAFIEKRPAEWVEGEGK